MNVLFFYHMLRMNGVGFLRSRYLVEDLGQHGHKVRLAYFVVDDKSQWLNLRDDAISFDEVAEFNPDVLIFELAGADRYPSRDWLEKLKAKGCMVVHCGLGYNDYVQHRKEYDAILSDGGFTIFKGAAHEDEYHELPDIRGEGQSQVTRTETETLKEYCAIQGPRLFENVSWVESHQALVIESFKHVLLTAGPHSQIKAYSNDRHGDSYAVYGAFNDTKGIEILITGHFVTDGREKSERQGNRNFLINVIEYFYAFGPSRYGITSDQPRRDYQPKIDEKSTAVPASILFLAADPTDASRLRLGEELREIQEKLQLARLRDRFELHQRMSVRPADLTQALLDVEPQIVHFSGHGMASGALCFEDQTGKTQPVEPSALAALFEQFRDEIKCVVLNACYSEAQANAIAKHIEYVVGMKQAIGDKAAIAFALGFYQAIGGGRTIEEAYKLGCIQIRLQGIPEHLTPILIEKKVEY